MNNEVVLGQLAFKTLLTIDVPNAIEHSVVLLNRQDIHLKFSLLEEYIMHYGGESKRYLDFYSHLIDSVVGNYSCNRENPDYLNAYAKLSKNTHYRPTVIERLHYHLAEYCKKGED